MPVPAAPDVTQLLVAWGAGDAGAFERLVPLVYTELHRLAHHYRRGERPEHHTLQTTALVNEAYLRLVDCQQVAWQNRTQFFALSARLMRRVLVDAARARSSRKRGGEVVHVMLDDSAVMSPERDDALLALDEALERLAALDERKSRVVELRYFGGLSVDETAGLLQVSAKTVARDWTMAKLWLLRELKGGRVDGGPGGP